MKALERVLRLPSLPVIADHVKNVMAPGTTIVLLDLVFSVTRGRPLGWASSAPCDATSRAGGRIAPNVLRIPLPWPLAEGLPEVRSISEYEHVEPVKVIVRDEHEQPLYVYAPRPCGQGYRSYAPGWNDWEDVSSVMTPTSYLASLEAELGYPGPPANLKVRQQRLFAELDRQTNVNLIDELVAGGDIPLYEADMRKMRISAVAQQLRMRVQERARRWTPGSTDLLLGAPDEALWKPKVQRLSQLLLDIVDAPPAVDFDGAFERFANGELRLQLPSLAWTTQPSSGFFFLFGEFALMACDYGVDRQRWEVLANVMVRMQPVFCRIYGPVDKAGADFFSYGAWNYSCSGAPYSDDELTSLRQTFAGKGFKALCTAAGKHAAENMPGLIV